MGCPTCADDSTLRECPDCHQSPRIVWVERLSKWVKLGGGATIAMTLAACYGPPQTDGGARMPAPDPTTTPADATQKAAETIGELAIGMKAQEVLTTLGEPQNRERAEAQQRWRYADGLVITMVDGADGQTIAAIEVSAPSMLATARGVKVGSTRAEVERVYEAKAASGATLVVGEIAFTFDKDVVTRIVLGRL